MISLDGERFCLNVTLRGTAGACSVCTSADLRLILHGTYLQYYVVYRLILAGFGKPASLLITAERPEQTTEISNLLCRGEKINLQYHARSTLGKHLYLELSMIVCTVPPGLQRRGNRVPTVPTQ